MKITTYTLNNTNRKANRRWFNILITCILDLNLPKYDFVINFTDFYFGITIKKWNKNLQKYYQKDVYWSKIGFDNYKSGLHHLIVEDIKKCILKLENSIIYKERKNNG